MFIYLRRHEISSFTAAVHHDRIFLQFEVFFFFYESHLTLLCVSLNLGLASRRQLGRKPRHEIQFLYSQKDSNIQKNFQIQRPFYIQWNFYMQRDLLFKKKKSCPEIIFFRYFYSVVFFVIFEQISNFRSEACNFIKKGTLKQVFSCEFCEICKNNFFP